MLITQGSLSLTWIDLLDKLGIEEVDGKLVVPVAAVVPAKFMGSGLGAASVASGDYDITTSDQEELKGLGLDQLRFGDLVALEDTDNRFGRSYRRGAVSIGVVVHSGCLIAGHGLASPQSSPPSTVR